jgi:heme/copper-type cytochrome/quinol oxidase subunit 2
MPGGLEWLIIALILLIVFVVPLAVLGIIVAMLVKRRKNKIVEQTESDQDGV